MHVLFRAFLACGFLWVFPVAAEIRFVGSAQVGLSPPAGFVESGTFSGFVSAEDGGSILINEMPAKAYASVSRVPDSGWATKGITVQSRTKQSIGSGQAVLLRGQQVASGVTFDKWILIIGFDDLTALISVQVPAPVLPERVAAIESALQTVQRRAALTLEEKVAALPFNMGPTGEMRVINVMAGNSILLTRGDKDIVINAEQPVMIVGRSFATNLPVGTTVEHIARARIQQFPNLKITEIESAKAVSFAGADGFEIMAKAIKEDTGRPVSVIQWIRLMDNSYLLAVGITSAEMRDTNFPLIQHVKDGIQIKEP